MSQDETEDNKVDETAAPASEQTNNQEDNANQVDETAKSVASAEEQNEIDYKAELEAAQTRLSQAEHTIVETKRKLKEATSSSGQGDVAIEPVTEQTSEDLAAQLRAENQAELDKFKREMTQDILEAELLTLSSNPDEAVLIKFHYENSIKQSGYSRASIRADLETAKLLANRKKLIKENSELKESLKAKASVGKAAGGSNQDRQVSEDEPNYTPEERASIKRTAARLGITEKEVIKRIKSNTLTAT